MNRKASHSPDRRSRVSCTKSHNPPSYGAAPEPNVFLSPANSRSGVTRHLLVHAELSIST